MPYRGYRDCRAVELSQAALACMCSASMIEGHLLYFEPARPGSEAIVSINISYLRQQPFEPTAGRPSSFSGKAVRQTMCVLSGSRDHPPDEGYVDRF